MNFAEEFVALKPTLPAGQLPVLEVDGVAIPQSKAIEGYAARVAGVYPTDFLQAAKVDVVREHIADITAALSPIVWGPAEKKEEGLKTFFETVAPVWLGYVEVSRTMQ